MILGIHPKPSVSVRDFTITHRMDSDVGVLDDMSHSYLDSV